MVKVMIDGNFVTHAYAKKLQEKGKIWYCDMCNEYHHSDIQSYTYNDTLKTCKVFKGSLCTCECCHTLYTRNMIKNLGNGYYCPNCNLLGKYLEGCKVNNYYYKPQKRYYRESKIYSENGDDFKGVGVELEVDSAGERNDNAEMTVKLLNDEVYIKHDGSLCNGFEIVTYPHTYDALLKMNWKNTLRELMLHGYRSHDSDTCGLHMHISRTLFTEEGIKNLMIFYDYFRDEIIKFARRDVAHADRWAHRWSSSGAPIKLMERQINEAYDNYNCSRNHDARYKAVNIVNPYTIEIRIMRGTLNYSSFSACLEFIYHTAMRANEISNPYKLEKWLDGLSENCINYMKKRECFGYKIDRPKVEIASDEIDDYKGDDLCA